MVTAAGQGRRLKRRRLLALLLLPLGLMFLAFTVYLALMDAIGRGGRPMPVPDLPSLERLSPGELADAWKDAQAAFARNPSDTNALIALARIAGLRGDKEASDRLKLIAGRMQPRSTAVQAEALPILLERRDFSGAMIKLDGLIRARPRRAGPLFAIVTDIAMDPEGRNIVSLMLAGNPPWRRQFLDHTVLEGKAGITQKLFADLRGLGAPPAPDELRLLIDSYIKKNDIDRAYAVWLSSLNDDEVKKVKLVYDGRFDEEVRSLDFDWTVTPSASFTWRRFPRSTASMDQTLQISFQEFEGSFRNVSQILRLRPGRHRLSGEVKFEGFQSLSGIVFRLYCRNGSQLAPASETAPLPESAQWILFEHDFVVPDADCPNQLLRLETQRSQDATQSTRGLLALDNLTIEVLQPLAP